MRKICYSMMAGVIAAVLTGCATTQMRSTWKAPDAQPISVTGQKVAAVVLMKSEADRRAAEDVLAAELVARGVVCEAAYKLGSDADLKDKVRAKALFAQSGIDWVVVMRPVTTENRIENTPGMWSAAPYNSYWGGYVAYGWGGMYDPGYVTMKTIITVETLLYSLKEDKLIWAGTSETSDPAGIKSFVCELTKSVSTAMRKDGVFVKSKP